MNELRRRIASIKKMAERHCPPEPSDRSHWYTSANDCVFLNSKDTNHVRPHTIIVASFQSQDEAQSATIALNQARPFEWALLNALAATTKALTPDPVPVS